jgi:hypothetical protein
MESKKNTENADNIQIFKEIEKEKSNKNNNGVERLISRGMKC